MNKKMADIDIDPFGNTIELKNQLMKIFLSPQLEEDQLGNRNMNKWNEKHHFEENLWKLLSMKPWKVLLKVCIKGFLEVMMDPQEQSIFIISTSEMDSYTTRNYKDNVNPLTTKKWALRVVGVLADRLGKEGLRDLGFDVPVGKITAFQFMASYREGAQLPSMS